MNIFEKTKNVPNVLKFKINHNFFSSQTWGSQTGGRGGPPLGKNSHIFPFFSGNVPKPPRTYSGLFIVKTFINHNLAVTSLNLNCFQVLRCIFSGRRYGALRMVVQTQFSGWKFSQLGTYITVGRNFLFAINAINLVFPTLPHKT